jgi:hypothetical protein
VEESDDDQQTHGNNERIDRLENASEQQGSERALPRCCFPLPSDALVEFRISPAGGSVVAVSGSGCLPLAKYMQAGSLLRDPPLRVRVYAVRCPSDDTAGGG